MANLKNFGRPFGHESQRRNDERRNCSIRCRLSTGSGEFDVKIVNLSASGAGIEADTFSRLRLGETASFATGPLSSVRATVRWASSPRYGLQFDLRPGTQTIVAVALKALPAP